MNFLPKNYDEYLVAKEIIKKISVESYIKGAQIITENGIGKLKKHIVDALHEGYSKKTRKCEFED